jgi:predicted nucleotidyltransferase component of viral defense system
LILEAELRRLAAIAGVDIMVQELDYALGWFLAGFFTQTPAKHYLVFKGGTCLRKCYFKDYRFSEDLDFTLVTYWSPDELKDSILKVRQWSASVDGPDFGAAPLRLEIVNDDYGSESYQARIYYRGPLRWGGPPRSIQLDVSRSETVVFPVAPRSLIHRYSDAERLTATPIPSYSLAEMLAEKLRAISGQRRFAVSRDIYDIYQLRKHNIDLSSLRSALPIKFAAKKMPVTILTAAEFAQRRQEFESDWRRRLTHLLPPEQPVTFDDAWASVTQLLDLLAA